jgi:hypothetical protein
MPTDDIVALLLAERDKLNRAIEALQGPPKRRGRPPKNGFVTSAVPIETTAPARKKRIFSAAQRKEQAERMKAFWAAKKSAAKKPVTKKKTGK